MATTGSTVSGGEGNDTLLGGDDDDWLSGSYGDDTLDGGKGADTLSGSDGNDTLNGGAGDDSISGEAGDDLLIGGVGNDKYFVTDGDDTVAESKNGGVDAIYTYISLTLGENIENAFAQASSLTITGNALDNYINGLDGADSLSGGIGADLLIGGAGADTLIGGDGNDVLEGSLGVDRIEGGAGNDLIRYRLGNPGDLDSLAGDLIVGFEAGKDKIDLYDLFVDFEISVEDPVDDGFLRLLANGGNTLLQFDKDGDGDSFVTLATLQGVTNATLADIIYVQGGGIE
jgi:Ca2+-binding RTX toxin-like protein